MVEGTRCTKTEMFTLVNFKRGEPKAKGSIFGAMERHMRESGTRAGSMAMGCGKA